MKIFVITHSPSPYQVEFFDEIEKQGACSLEVAYLRKQDPRRRWERSLVNHASIELEGSRTAMSRARESAREADLVVFNYYMHSLAEQLLSERVAAGGPWCFWGERPGFRQPAWAGRLVRKWKLSRLHASAAPIWGIGKFAVDEYRREFGPHRSYFNLPYFSDLQRFSTFAHEERGERVFMFCGSLIKRKGVDLVSSAFVRLAREVPHVRLRIVGEGQLRSTLTQTLRSVSDRVEFAGFRDWHDLPREYALADVLCVPSRYDGWGLVVAEGLAAGLPVIATDRMGAALEFLETGRNGWLIPAGDEEALLNVMRKAALLPHSTLTQLGRQARETVGTHTLQNGARRFLYCASAAFSSVSSALSASSAANV